MQQPKQPTQPIDEISTASTVVGAKILGIAADGQTKLYSVSDIKGDFKGLATPATDPGIPVLAQYYHATPGVTYPLFKNSANEPIVVPLLDGGLTVFDATMIWDNGAWMLSYGKTALPAVDLTAYAKTVDAKDKGVFDSVELAIAGVPVLKDGVPYRKLGDTVGINTGGVITEYWWKSSTADAGLVLKNDALTSDNIGLTQFKAGYDILKDVSQSDINNSDLWDNGYYNDLGVLTASALYKSFKPYIEAFPGTFTSIIKYSGNGRVVAYDKDKKFISAIANPTGESIFNFNLVLPANTAFIRVPHLVQFPHNDVKALATAEYLRPTATVFETPDSVNSKLATLATKTELNSKLSQSDIGVTAIQPNTNYIAELAASSITDNNIWVDGYYPATGVLTASVAYRSTKNFIKADPGLYNAIIKYSGNARILCYDKNFTLISAIANPTGQSLFIFDITLPAGTEWIKFSHLTQFTHTDIKLSNVNKVVRATSEVFTTQSGAETVAIEVTQDILGKYGFENIPVGTNFVAELTNSTVTDTAIWKQNSIYIASGIVATLAGWVASEKRYRVYPGLYRLKGWFRNATPKVLILDENLAVVLSITGTTPMYDADLIIPATGKFIVFSHDAAKPTSDISLVNKEVIYPGGAGKTASSVSQTNTDTPLNGLAVTSFMRDIYKNTHKAKSKKAIASFISDDCHIRNNDWYIPMLEAKGIKSTFAVITGFLDSNPLFMTKARVKELNAQGHDMAGHTVDHLHMADLTLDQVEYQLSRCKTDMLKMGLTSPVFIAPYSSRTDDVSRIVRKYWKTDWKAVTPGMIADGTCCNTPPVESYLLKRIPLDAQANGVSTIAAAKAAVDVAYAKNEWVAFAIHPQYAEYHPDENPDGYAAKRAELSDLIDYILSKSIQILPVREALEIWHNPVEIGNYRLDTKYYELGMDGTERGNYFE